MKVHSTWVPAALLVLGAIGVIGTDSQRSMPLRAALDEVVPRIILDAESYDIEISEEEQIAAGMDAYVMRAYDAPVQAGVGAAVTQFTVYVGYYEQQYRGHTIHSPKNCLPGAGWDALTSKEAVIATAAGNVTVNQYLLKNGDAQALVLYWYQGRGRVEANEYRVKWDLLRDAAVRRRSDEALVRIVVPVTQSEELALAKGAVIASDLIPAVYRALPM